MNISMPRVALSLPAGIMLFFNDFNTLYFLWLSIETLLPLDLENN
jgi:hypothetical protein